MSLLRGLFGPPDPSALRDQGDTAGLIKALGYKKDASIRQGAAIALGELGSAEALPPLMITLADVKEDFSVRRAAACAVGAIGDRRAVKALALWLPRAGPELRPEVMLALGTLGGPEAVAALIPYLSDQEASARLASAEALSKAGESVAAVLVDALDDAQPEVRRKIAAGLGQLDDPTAVPALIASLQDDDREVRLQAAGALAKIGDTRAVEPLLDRLTAQEDYARVQIVCVIGLGDLRDPRAIPALVRILEVGDPIFRSAAAESLGKIGLPGFASTDAILPLTTALRDQDPFVRRLAVRALGQIADRRALVPLRGILQDDDQGVRTVVKEALQVFDDGADPTASPGQEADKISLLGREEKGQYSYTKYRGPDAASARAFLLLKRKEVNKPNRYVTVETPEGIWGVDKEGLYLVRLLPWQSDLSRAQCTGAVIEPPTPFSLQQAILQDAVDNYIATVQCGYCSHRWQDGLNYLAPTIVLCPGCSSYNRIESAVRPA